MLKMTIDNEEVVSNKDISIKEEILSPSSTILNNVYPKEWENDKDYTSRFYYPKDYSKLNIQNFSVEPEEAGTTVEINGSATINDVDTTKESRVISLKGQTSQDGTPTPTTPIPVNVVSGDNYINICGKNLANPNNLYLGQTINGATGELLPNQAKRTAFLKNHILPSTGYTFSVSSAYRIGNIFYYDKNKTLLSSEGGSWELSKTFTTPSNAYYVGTALKRNDDADMTQSDLGALHLQLELGTATTYEPYIGNTYPIYLGVENLCKPITTATKSGITMTNNGDGSYTLNGTATANTSFYNATLNLGLDTYTFSANNPVASSNGGFYFQVEYQGGGVTAKSFNDVNAKKTFTTTKNIIAWVIVVPNGITLNNFVIKPQLEKGSKVNSFNKYGVQPIELCKIGTYQDYIYKDNGSWYLHKEIGKFYSDSTTGWIYDNNYRYSRAFENIVVPPNNDTVGQGYCNVRLVTANQTLQTSTTPGLAIHPISRLYISKVVYDNLPTTPIVLYYAYITPITTEITDTTLIEQLEALSS